MLAIVLLNLLQSFIKSNYLMFALNPVFNRPLSQLKRDDITNYINVKHSCQEFSLFQIEIRDKQSGQHRARATDLRKKVLCNV